MEIENDVSIELVEADGPITTGTESAADILSKWATAQIIDLGVNECRFIEGEASAFAAYCRRPTRDGSSFCPAHKRIVYEPPGFTFSRKAPPWNWKRAR
jgi:hypothetical protein